MKPRIIISLILLGYSIVSSLRLSRNFHLTMGGNSFAQTKVSRLKLETFNKIKDDVQHHLQKYFKTDICYHMPEKIEFGDIDIIYIAATDHGFTMLEIIEKIFNPKEIVVSGDVLSFTYFLEESHEFYQVDMILVEDLTIGKFYFSYGDTGNLLGHITDLRGIKFGITGLYVYLHNRILEDSGIEHGFASAKRLKIALHDCPKEICDFLGMDFNAWGRFTTDAQVFEWIKTCNMFNKDTFNFGGSNHRKKYNRRKMFSAFCDSIDSVDGKFATAIGDMKMIPDDTAIVEEQLRAIHYFGKETELNVLIQVCKDQYKVATERKNKFNGQKFLAYGIENKTLGSTIISFKKYIMVRYDLPDFEHWLDRSDCDQVDASLADFFQVKG